MKLRYVFGRIFGLGSSCAGGELSVYDGAVNAESLMRKVCGHQLPWSVVTKTNRLHLRLYTPTNANWTQNGFSMSYTTIGK